MPAPSSSSIAHQPAKTPGTVDASMVGPIVSVILVAHDEGLLLHRTLRSLDRAVHIASERGHTIETLLCLDRPSRGTLEYLARSPFLPDRVHEFDLGDPGLVRNAAVALTTGRYVAFLDGDDLYSTRFLAELAQRITDDEVTSATAQPAPVYHAAATLLFEGQRMLFEHIGSESPDFSVANFQFHCEWTCQFAAPRSAMLAYLFEATSGTPFGFEDWHVMGKLLATGHPIRLVERVTNFVRRKRTGGRHAAHKSTGTMLRPCPLFAQNGPASEPEISPTRFVVPHRPSSRTLTSALLTTAARRGVPFFRGVMAGAARFVSPRRFAPDWVRDEIAAIHDIEPLLTPDDAFLRRLWPYRPPRTVRAARFADVIDQLPRDLSHLFWCPGSSTAGPTWRRCTTSGPCQTKSARTGSRF